MREFAEPYNGLCQPHCTTFCSDDARESPVPSPAQTGAMISTKQDVSQPRSREGAAHAGKMRPSKNWETVPPDKRPMGWREEMLADLNPLSAEAFRIRNIPLTKFERKDMREFERELYADRRLKRALERRRLAGRP